MHACESAGEWVESQRSRHTSTRIIVGWDRESTFACLVLKQLGVASPIHRRFKLPHSLVCRIIFIKNVEKKIGAHLMIVLLLQCLVDRCDQGHVRQYLLPEELFRVQNIRLGKFSADVCN